MAKITKKKVSKKKSTKTKTKVVEVVETTKKLVSAVEVAAMAPLIELGNVNVTFSKEDLGTFINLMAICVETFQSMALVAANQNDEKRFKILSARHQISLALANQLIAHYSMGEFSSQAIN